MKFQVLCKWIGTILGGLLVAVIVLLGVIGCRHSFVYDVDYHKKADKAIEEQPVIFHYLPKECRYGIYDVQHFFSDTDE